MDYVNRPLGDFPNAAARDGRGDVGIAPYDVPLGNVGIAHYILEGLLPPCLCSLSIFNP